MKNHEIEIRTASVSDAEKLLEIYKPYVEKTAITFEYEVPSPEEFTLRIENTLKKYPYLVALKDGKILGYAYASEFKGRAAYDWAVETSIYIAEAARGTGIGKKLYQSLEKSLVLQNILNMNACIACTDNEDEHLTNGSIAFHEKMGFLTVGKFHAVGYKFGKWYDMIWMEKHIGDHNENPRTVKKFCEIKDFLKFN